VQRKTQHASSVQGDPNMGKSSVINSVFGKKVVSSSATPGKQIENMEADHANFGI
jgi:ribosome biogenesis GTPase A